MRVQFSNTFSAILAVAGFLGPSLTISGYLGLSKAIPGYLWLFLATSGYHGLSGRRVQVIAI